MKTLILLALVLSTACGSDVLHSVSIDCKDDANCTQTVDAVLRGIDSKMYAIGVETTAGLLTDFYVENGLLLTIYGSDAPAIGCPDGAIGCTAERQGSIYISMYRGQLCEAGGGTLSHENLHALSYALGGDGDPGHMTAGWWGRSDANSYESQLASVDWCSPPFM